MHPTSTACLQGVLSVEDEELVSCDFLGHPCSTNVDAKASKELNNKARMFHDTVSAI